MKAAVKIYAMAVCVAVAVLFTHAWIVHPEIDAKNRYAKNCWLWYSMNQKNYRVTMERLKLRVGKD